MVRRLASLTGVIAFVITAFWIFSITTSGPHGDAIINAELRVLTYSAFTADWGPGPEIAQRFEREKKIKVRFQDAGDAGLLLAKLSLFKNDVVLGLDQFQRVQAQESFRWRKIGSDGQDFTSFDRGALTFIYRTDKVKPPTSIPDLSDSRFKSALALESPETSSPGLQFYFWILDSLGIEPGLAYLARLRANVHTVSPSWSLAYGIFSRGEYLMAFSYVTSAVYHWIEPRRSSLSTSDL